MTTRERLTGEGFFFFMFTTTEARTEFMERAPAATFEFECFTEVHCHQEFVLHFLGVRRLHHTPVRFTRAEEV